MTTATPITPADSTPVGTLEHLDPNTLHLRDNVRDDAALSKQFVNSIAELGVLQPITAVRDGDAIVVRTGQRRTLAARQVGLPTIPVYVLPAALADASAETIDRLVQQIVENDHRAELSETQRARGIQQILDAGLSITKAAKKLAVARDTVKAAQSAAGSDTAMEALASGQVSLTEAAVIAEFEDDAQAVERLLQYAGRGGTYGFDHAAAQLREDRAAAQELAAAEQVWRERGYTILSEQPRGFDPHCVQLNSLVTADGEPVEEMIADPNPAHWAVLLYEETGLTDKETGEPVDEEDVDWDTQGRTDATPGEGLRHADTVFETTGYVPDYYCLDYQAAGLRPNERYISLGGKNRFGPDTADEEGSEQSTPASPDELAARRQRAAEEEARAREETEKRERRKTLALNKLGAAALTVRREFVTTLLARKTPPKGAAMFVANALATDAYLLTCNHAAETAAELCGVHTPREERKTSTGYQYQPPTSAVRAAVRALPENSDARAAVLTLGLVLGALEARTPKDAWRTSGGGNYFGSKEYLQFLADNGYTLAPIEEVMIGKRKADKLFNQVEADK